MKCPKCQKAFTDEQFRARTAAALFEGSASDITDLEDFGEAVCPGCDAHLNNYNGKWESDNMTKPMCPRCGRHNMDEVRTRNALSRNRKAYICPPCGTAEALLAAAGQEDGVWVVDTIM